jgi:hypothetical protein
VGADGAPAPDSLRVGRYPFVDLAGVRILEHADEVQASFMGTAARAAIQRDIGAWLSTKGPDPK